MPVTQGRSHSVVGQKGKWRRNTPIKRVEDAEQDVGACEIVIVSDMLLASDTACNLHLVSHQASTEIASSP